MADRLYPFTAEKITDNVYWVGAIDWQIADFHGYRTSRGTTYNAFLVCAEKITLIDTVKAPHKEEMLSRIASVIDPSSIDIIISNHAEMDHSGCLPTIIEELQPSQVYASKAGAKALAAHFPSLEGRLTPVETGDTVSLGDRELHFVETKMVHWPDSMVSYLTQDKVLFSQDAFGMHLATSALFADENDRAIMQWEAEKYYANIVMPYSAQVQKALEAVKALDVPIDIIAPDHGPIYRTADEIAWILAQYEKWVNPPPARKVVVVYDTMWHSTDRMAEAVAEGCRAVGVPVRVLPMSGAHRSDVVTEVLESGALIVGSATMNSGILPAMADVLTYLRGLKPQNLIGAVFGSYGWNKQCFKELEGYMAAMGVETIAPPVCVNYVPTADDLVACRTLGMTVAEAVQKRLKEDE